MAKKEEKVHVEKKPKKKLAGTVFASIIAIVTLLAGVYLLLMEFGLYKTEIPRIAIIVILILSGLTSLMQVAKMNTLARLERMKSKYI